VFGCISVVVVEGAYVRHFMGLGLCKVGTVGWSAGDECVEGMGGLVTGLGRMRGKGGGKRVDENGQNELLGRKAMDFSTREGGRVKGVRVGMRQW
jgi:hypothetical protein